MSVERWPHAELHYFVLSHLDLGADAANLHRADRDDKPWRGELEALYRAAPGRIYLQVIPLYVDDLDTELQWLRSGRLPALRDDDSLRAARLMADVLELEAREQRPPDAREFGEAFQRQLGVLAELRSHLWASAQREPPPLTIVDCPSLASGRWTHGRGAPLAGSHRVAVALDTAPVCALTQVLHEEIHPVSDPAVRARFDDLAQETEAGRPGFELHAAIEQRAIEVGRRLVEAHAPSAWREVYRAWCGRFGGG
ncbi:MAG: hypothetical protein ACOC9W_00410 [Persicimonas sp.]